MSDQEFINLAAQTDMVEANLGQLAQSASSSQPVKDYAQMLVTDHTKDFDQLYALAHQANLSRPDAIDTAHNKAMIAPFQKLTGTAFDHRYIHDMIAGHTQAVGAAMIEERVQLLPLTEQGFELVEVCFPRVDGLGCVRVRTNLYSVPAKPGRTVEVRLYPSYVEIRDEGRCIARHERCSGRHSRYSIWNTTSTCWSESQEHLSDRSRSSRGAHVVYGRRITIICSKR